MRVHELKAWPEPFQAVLEGRKTFEFRYDDRGFAINDELLLREWDPTPSPYSPRGYTLRQHRVKVTYVLHGGSFGVPKDYVVMGITPSANGADAGGDRHE